MADDDEIDILGDFSFNSCFAQNNQGIPSCSSREDTVHPQWLLDSSETNNWYDKQSKDSLQSLRNYSGPSRRLLGDHSLQKHNIYPRIVWTQAERNTLAQEMVKYGRNIKKISQTLKTKTEAEIQALIDAEFGLHIETTSQGIDKFEDHADITSVVREEIVTDDSHRQKAVTITPAAAIATHQFHKKSFKVRSKNTLLKPNPYEKTELIDSSEIFYEDDMIIGSTESIGSELDTSDKVYKNIAKHQAKVKAEKKIGNHRRKVSRNYDKGARSLLKSPPGRQRKDSSLSDDSVKSPKMQIVLGSGQALPVSEGEQVIKIEKKKESEPESDIDIDIDSDDETKSKPKAKPDAKLVEEPIAVPLRKFEPMPRRQKKINLDGGGGYTIMHTDAGDLYEVGSEPRREKPPKKQPIHLIRCRVYNAEKPAPYDVRLHVSTLILMDGHAHTSRGEVMGLTGGAAAGRCVTVSAYIPAAAAAGSTHCDMDPGTTQLEVMGLTGGAAAGRCVTVSAYIPAAAAASSTHCDMDPGTTQLEVMGLTGGAAAGRCVTVSAYIPAAAAASSTHCDMDPGTTQLEVMGLTGGAAAGRCVTVSAYIPAAAAAGSTHCDMDPVSQSSAAERLSAVGLAVCGWHHSHPVFPSAPSAQDLQSQRALQRALEWRVPLLGFITSQHWPPGRRASQYRCLRVEEDEAGSDTPVGYQFSVKLVADLTPATLPAFLRELRAVLHHDDAGNQMKVDLLRDVCPQARMTYLEKFISSVSQHMCSAGYSDEDPTPPQLIRGLRDVLR